MPLSIFNPSLLSYYREVSGASDHFGHIYGGNAAARGIRFVNLKQPLHLIYHLNLADPAIGISLPGINWLPLCYSFSDPACSDLTYRVLNDGEVEVLVPSESIFDSDFPYENYPAAFPESKLMFARQPYDATQADQALSLAAVFGIEQLPAAELQRAIQLVEQEGLFREWRSGSFAHWSDEDLIRSEYKEPFMQGAPSKKCENPGCAAEIIYRTEPMTYRLSKELFPDWDEADLEMHLEAMDIRRDTKHVFALHQPAEDDRHMWGDPYVQLIFQICDECQCISVTNQCT